MEMQVPDNSVNALQNECAPFTLGSNVLKLSNALNALHVPNLLDELDLTDEMSSLNLTEEQQKDDNIRLRFQWCFIYESILKARVNQRPHVASYDFALSELAWCLRRV